MDWRPNTRPSSSLSVARSASRLSQRHAINRPASRHAIRIAGLRHDLVAQVTGMSPDSEDYRTTIANVNRALDHASRGQAPSIEEMDRAFRGYGITSSLLCDRNSTCYSRVDKARINVQDTLANALELRYKELKDSFKKPNLDSHITVRVLWSGDEAGFSPQVSFQICPTTCNYLYV
jgi:hypothetical protein